MRATPTLHGLAALVLLAPALAVADPPPHAPAHGHRAKRAPEAAPAPRPGGGIEVVFDSERGIHVAVGLPGIFFHEGRYYREHDGRWQVSATGRGDWRVAGSVGVPDVVVKAKGRGPGPAKVHGKRR